MNELKRKYFVSKEAAEVSKEVFTIYHQMERQERYQIERDQKNGLLHYDAWDTEDLNGIEYIRDKTVNVEDTVIEKLICQKAMQAVENYDKHGILQLFLLGFTETEIARKIGVSQAYVNQTKNKLRKKIQTYMENDICN